MKECAHPACTCRHETDEMTQQGEGLYCNNHCAEQDPASDGCDCGHEQCDG